MMARQPPRRIVIADRDRTAAAFKLTNFSAPLTTMAIAAQVMSIQVAARWPLGGACACYEPVILGETRVGHSERESGTWFPTEEKEYRDQLKKWYVVARNFFLLFLDFSAWPCFASFAHF